MQFDYGGWMPNFPSSLQLPPPTRKGTANEATMLQTLPDVNITVLQMASLWLLSKQSIDFVSDLTLCKITPVNFCLHWVSQKSSKGSCHAKIPPLSHCSFPPTVSCFTWSINIQTLAEKIVDVLRSQDDKRFSRRA